MSLILVKIYVIRLPTKTFFGYSLSRCIFLSGNGAFFVNYVTTAAFIGTALELIRFSELFMYAMRLSCARSSAEKSTVRKVTLSFSFF